MAGTLQLVKLFSRKRNAAEESLYSLVRLNEDESKLRFEEEIIFENEVAQAAAVCAIMFSSPFLPSCSWC